MCQNFLVANQKSVVRRKAHESWKLTNSFLHVQEQLWGGFCCKIEEQEAGAPKLFLDQKIYAFYDFLKMVSGHGGMEKTTKIATLGIKLSLPPLFSPHFVKKCQHKKSKKKNKSILNIVESYFSHPPTCLKTYVFSGYFWRRRGKGGRKKTTMMTLNWNGCS